MGFSWTPITQYVTEVKAAHINQVKTNVDSVYTDLELDAYSWAYLPVNVGDEIQHEDFKEMRDAIDYADNMNYCRSHDVSYMGADDAVARGTVLTGENTGYDSGYKAGVDGAYRSGYYSGYKAGVDSGYKGSACGPVNTGVDNSAYTGVESAYNTAVDGAYYSSFDTRYHATQ